MSGCPVRVVNHAIVASCCALDMMRAMDDIRTRLSVLVGVEKSYLFNTEDHETPTLDAHIGLNTGRINAGVVGTNNPRFKLFGDTVNMASRMESTCPHGKIQVSKLTHRFIENNFLLEDRGLVQVKGKGEQHTYFLIGTLPGGERIVPIILRDGNHTSTHLERNDNSALYDSEGKKNSNTITATNTDCSSINDRSNGPPLSVSQRQMFWSKEKMAAYPRARLRAWSKRARISCAAERRKWSTSHQNHKPPAILLTKNTNMSPKPLTPEVLPILNGTGENTSNYTSNDMQYPNYPTQRPPTLQLDGELRSISSISFTPSASSSHSHSRSPSSPSSSWKVNRKRLGSRNTSMSNGSNDPSVLNHTVHNKKRSSGRRSSIFKKVGLQKIAELEVQKKYKEQMANNHVRRASSKGKIAGVSAVQMLMESANSKTFRRQGTGGSVVSRSSSLNMDKTSGNISLSQADLMIGKIQPSTPRGSTSPIDIPSHSTLSKVCFPELDSSPIARETYRLVRCLTKREMRDINFDQLQRNDGKFNAFQQQKYHRQNILVLMLFSFFFVITVWYDFYQFQPMYQSYKTKIQTATTSPILTSREIIEWNRVEKIFLRVGIRTGGIGVVYIIILLLTLWYKKILRKTSLMLLFLTGIFTLVLCFETGCHGDNTYFVMWACAM